MFPVVEFPEIVQYYAPHFRQVFSTEAMIQFERYISGLIVSENKTVDGINRLLVEESRNQSSLNRLLNRKSVFAPGIEPGAFELAQSVAGTQMKAYRRLSIDDTLLTHYGEHFEGIAWLYDHTTDSYTWAHSLVTLHYSDDQCDYPLFFQLWKPMDLEKMERGLEEAGIELKAEKLVSRRRTPTSGVRT